MAHASLATLYINLQEPSLSAESMKRAYDLRDRVSEAERFYIESSYYRLVTGELEKANQVSELWAQTYPRSDALVNVAVGYACLGQYEKAVAATLEALRRDPDNYVASTNLVAIYTNLNRLDDARATYQKMLESKRDYPDTHVYLHGVAAAQGDAGRWTGLTAKWESRTSFSPSRLTPKHSTDVLARPGNSPARQWNRPSAPGRKKPRPCGK